MKYRNITGSISRTTIERHKLSGYSAALCNNSLLHLHDLCKAGGPYGVVDALDYIRKQLDSGNCILCLNKHGYVDVFFKKLACRIDKDTYEVVSIWKNNLGGK